MITTYKSKTKIMKNKVILSNRDQMKRWSISHPELNKQLQDDYKNFSLLLNNLKHCKDAVRKAVDIVAADLGFEDSPDINKRRFTKEQGGII